MVEEHLDEGSYLLEIDRAGSGALRYPVEIERGRPWTHTPPEHDEAVPLDLPSVAESDREIVVPEGWFRCGHEYGDRIASLPDARVWL
ncbi:MAG: hypothetical protein ABEK29_03400, partial [Bradymonadaceae bacterium]